jgi:adenylate cyclase class IV
METLLRQKSEEKDVHFQGQMQDFDHGDKKVRKRMETLLRQKSEEKDVHFQGRMQDFDQGAIIGL